MMKKQKNVVVINEFPLLAKDRIMKTIDRETSNKVSFMTFIITKFARAYKMNSQQAYLYLKKYGGMDFLNKHWWALHTDNPFWAVRDLYEVCYDNGGVR